MSTRTGRSFELIATAIDISVLAVAAVLALAAAVVLEATLGLQAALEL